MTTAEGTHAQDAIHIEADLTESGLGTFSWTPGEHTQGHLRELRDRGELDELVSQLQDAITQGLMGTAVYVCDVANPVDVGAALHELLTQVAQLGGGRDIRITELGPDGASRTVGLDEVDDFSSLGDFLRIFSNQDLPREGGHVGEDSLDEEEEYVRSRFEI